MAQSSPAARVRLVLLALAIAACGPTAPSGGDGDGGAAADASPGTADGGANHTCDPDLANPTPEVCDSYDNDCNGLVDDGVTMPNPSGCGLLYCHLGDWRPGDDVGGADEVCNNHDDDCDGMVDEGLGRADPTNPCRHQTCVGGAWVDDTPGGSGTDDCDGFDNDCDGQIDEDFDGDPCFASCGGLPTFGTEVCLNGEVVCEPADFPISPEVCNGEDDDCDEFVDEGIPPRPCACGTGEETCVNGQWTGCTGGCAEGTTRWCDEPMYCHWGQQTCELDPDGVGRWGTCAEVSTMPPGCSGPAYDPDCCVAAGECCQDAFDTWESVGDCAEQCP